MVKALLVSLPFMCPYCNPTINHNSSSGSGVLCILSPVYWVPLKDTPLKDLRPMDWAASLEWNEMSGSLELRHMAWIPMPEGYVSVESIGEEQTVTGGDESINEEVIGGREELGRFGYVQRSLITQSRTQVRSVRKEKIGVGSMMSKDVGTGSRMAGLISQFRAAVKSGEMAGRYQ
jgi:hypothetical protein